MTDFIDCPNCGESVRATKLGVWLHIIAGHIKNLIEGEWFE